MRGTFVSWCEELEGAAVAPTLDHNDLHPWNIFAGGAESVRFYDWGDSVGAHPFASLAPVVAK
jgi:aminoglycoside phosphotransferase (APT) family kinase protein